MAAARLGAGAGAVAFLAPQIPGIATGFAIIWALAWRHQYAAVAAIEGRDGARFYVERDLAVAADHADPHARLQGLSPDLERRGDLRSASKSWSSRSARQRACAPPMPSSWRVLRRAGASVAARARSPPRELRTFAADRLRLGPRGARGARAALEQARPGAR